MRAIRIDEFGGPEVMSLVEDQPVPQPGDDEVLIKVDRIGVNFADTHARENSYLAKQQLPLVPGGEVAGVVERGNGFAPGTRVAAMMMNGAYAEYASAPSASVFPLPDGLDDGAALALLIQGLTAWHLYRTSAKLAQGETVVVHAAAGGVGSLAVQLGKPMGAGRVIATASTEEKRAQALELGADAAVDTGEEDLAGALREANGGDRVDVVFEMSGGRVFDQSLLALAPFGRLVTYGIASREQNQVSNAGLLRGSKAVVGFWLAHCTSRPEMVAAPLQDLFERTARGELKPLLGRTYGLSEARQAHQDLTERRTTGKLTLDPDR